MIDLGSELAGYGDEPPPPSRMVDGYIPKGGTVPLADLQASGFNQPMLWQILTDRSPDLVSRPAMPDASKSWMGKIAAGLAGGPNSRWHYIAMASRCYQCKRYLPDWENGQVCPDCPLPA